MNWFSLSLLCAFLTATTAAFSKLLLKKQNEFFVAWALFAFGLPVLLTVFILNPKPHLASEFWKTVFIMLPLEITAILFYFKALKISPISLTFPFLGLTPVFTIFTSRLMLKEGLGPCGITGIMLVSLGAYLLNIRSLKEGVFAPIKHIYKEKGALLMIAVSFIYSFTVVLGKKAVLLSSVTSFPAIYYGMVFAILTPFLYLKLKSGGEKIHIEKKEMLLFLIIGAAFATSMFSHFKAITLAKAAYMVSVKRLSLVISILYGAVLFKEKNLGFRLLGASVMTLGVAILAFV